MYHRRRPLIENLESRQLLHGVTSISVDFAPAGAPLAGGTVGDAGYVFGPRDGGNEFGWSKDVSADAVARTTTYTPYQRGKTFITMNDNVWEMHVHDGIYSVKIGAGDPESWGKSIQINAEGKTVVTGSTTSTKRLLTGTTQVQVTDGKLTVAGATGAYTNTLGYIEITYVGPIPTPDPDPNPTTGALPATIDFAPAYAAIATGTLGDYGGVFANQPSGHQFGWSQDVSANAVQRVSTYTPYQRGKTFILMNDSTWEMSLPTGKYSIKIGAGDPESWGKSIKITAEGKTVVTGSTTSTKRLLTGSTTVDVIDGKLTIAGASGAYANTIGYIEIAYVGPASTGNPTPGGTINWTTAASLPVGKAEAFGGAIGGKLYLFGGYVDNTFRPVDTAHVYNPATNTWSAIAQMPIRVSHAATAYDTRYFYFAGGYPATTTGQSFATSKVYRYDTQTNTYAPLPDLPAARGAAAGALVGNVFYVMGGADASRNDRTEVWALDLNNLAAGWTAKASLPAARNHPAAVTVAGQIYFLGGQTGQDLAASNKTDVWRYDPTSNTWSARAPLPSPRSHITNSTFVHNGAIYALGGEGPNGAKLKIVERYDPTTNTWSAFTPLPTARFSGVSDVIDGKIYFTSGYYNTFEKTTWIGTFA